MCISCKAINHNKTNTYESISHLENQNMTNTREFTHGTPSSCQLSHISDKTILKFYVFHSLLIFFSIYNSFPLSAFMIYLYLGFSAVWLWCIFFQIIQCYVTQTVTIWKQCSPRSSLPSLILLLSNISFYMCYKHT